MNPGVALALIGTALAALVFVGPSLVINPRQMELIQLHERVESLNSQLRSSTLRLVEIRRRSDEVQAELTKVQEQLRIQMDLLPSLEHIPELVKSIIDRGAGLGLEFVSVLPVPDKMFGNRQAVFSVNGRILCELPIQVQVRGRYRQLAQYLEALRDIRYSSRIDEVDLKRNEQPESPGLLVMTVQLNFLYL